MLKEDRIVELSVSSEKPDYKFRAIEQKVENGYHSGHYCHGYPTLRQAITNLIDLDCDKRKLSPLSARTAAKIEQILSKHSTVIFFYHKDTQQFVVYIPGNMLSVGKTLWKAIKNACY